MTLSFGPEPGSQFVGWLGDCTGRGECVVSMTRAATVYAYFAPNSAPMTLDADRNGAYEALTDGLLLIRYMMGLTGGTLTAGIVPESGSAALIARLNDLRPILDVDGNGRVDALTDGILVLRYLFGLRGDALVVNAIGKDATRSTADAVARYVQTFVP